MELVNATVRASDAMYNFIDWFALLNHGEKITAVGSSDSHTVGDPVGQGRTYLVSSTDDPGAIDVDEVGILSHYVNNIPGQSSYSARPGTLQSREPVGGTVYLPWLAHTFEAEVEEEPEDPDPGF